MIEYVDLSTFSVQDYGSNKLFFFVDSHHFPLSLSHPFYSDPRSERTGKEGKNEEIEIYREIRLNCTNIYRKMFVLDQSFWLLNGTSCKSLIKSVDCLCVCAFVYACGRSVYRRITQTNFNHIGV